MDGLSDAYEFFESMSYLWIANQPGFIAVAVYIFLFLSFLFFWVLKLMTGVFPILSKLTEMLNSFARAIKGTNMSIFNFSDPVSANSNHPSHKESADGMAENNEETNEEGDGD